MPGEQFEFGNELLNPLDERTDLSRLGDVVEGIGALEYGSRSDERREGRAGECFYISPGTVHCHVNATDEEIVVLGASSAPDKSS
ncbi:cupin domain-containing protein [Natrinema gelatinilyticum]|uniref:cupin domain-containing protein n=1 Tax=Natrinema gelatinilyticum TaxID=2961571 RepID=UPI0020C25EE9|nr:cupin domain-containing protein [Natrinema gelatinilyticum]